MMAKKPSALASIFDDEPETVVTVAPEPELETSSARGTARQPRRVAEATAPAKRSSHPGKKPVLIHIPEDMHRTLRQLSVEEGGEPLTVITERLLRQYLVKRGHTKFAP
ncbi:hypothetical protein NPJ82_18085 (plasmid) [Sphingomonas sp. NY01]|uniref:hypothetical protein n=1 Tax=Sphingomonas sp. NY01 TaxID=2968057 RepID=UPI00315D75A9